MLTEAPRRASWGVLLCLAIACARSGLPVGGADAGPPPPEPEEPAPDPCPDRDGDGVRSCDGDCDDRDESVAPGRAEACDGRDQDCDGDVDEGALFACGDCRPGCRFIVLPDDLGPDWLAIASGARSVGLDARRRLVLRPEPVEVDSAWIANTRYGTLTRLDLGSGAQVAEIDTVLVDGTSAARPPGEECDAELGMGNCPSRTAVDFEGNVYVANRAFGGVGTVTKIAGDPTLCIDRDGDGRIETSADLDGDGIIERGVPGEYLGQEDECLLWTVDVGEAPGVPRAIAVDREGDVWVGNYLERRVYELDAGDGSVLRSTPVLPMAPYGGAIGPDGMFWLVEDSRGRVGSLDTRTGRFGTVFRIRPAGTPMCRGSYGIAVDIEGSAWVSGFQCPRVYRFIPDTFGPTLRGGAELPDSGATRGVAVDVEGQVYVATSHEFVRLGSRPEDIEFGEPVTRLTRLTRDGTSPRPTDITVWGMPDEPLPGLGATGVAVVNGAAWLVNAASGTVTRVDLATGRTLEVPVGDTPYTYSDFTGIALQTVTARDGYLRVVVPGCTTGPTEWEEMTWEASGPGGSRVDVRVRFASDPAELRGRPWSEVADRMPFLLDRVRPRQERFMEVELTLVGGDEPLATPSVERARIRLNCPEEA